MPLALRHAEIRIQAEHVWLDAFLGFAPDVRGLVICAVPHLARLKEARETRVCKALEEAGFGTLLLSLLTPYEDTRDPDVRYDIALISQRLHAVTAWIEHQPVMGDMPLGIVASSTIAAGAMRLASQDPTRFAALVSKAGRIDLAGASPLRQVSTPSLVLIPGDEPDLRHATSAAYALLGGEKRLVVVEGAGEDFIEPGSLETVAQAACEWLGEHMPTVSDLAPLAAEESAPFCE